MYMTRIGSQSDRKELKLNDKSTPILPTSSSQSDRKELKPGSSTTGLCDYYYSQSDRKELKPKNSALANSHLRTPNQTERN